MKTYQNWEVVREEHLIWAYINRPDKSANALNMSVLNELSDILTSLKSDNTVKGFILASKKQSGFIAGADIEQFQFKNRDDAMILINKGQEVCNQLEQTPFATVAMISGFCLGGGLELSLACRYRVADDNTKTRLGLPEVLLGIHPGWGGSVRLLRMIGAINGMDLVLSGRTVSGKAAAKMGFVDIAVPTRHLVQAAKYYALKQPKLREATLLQRLTNAPLVRPLLGQVFKKKVAQKASPEHYPAPFAVIKNWVKVGIGNEQKALRVEAESLGDMALTDTAKNLVRVFFLQEQLKGLGKNVNFKAKHVHVVGAGTMGGDIASWCALRGLTVTLQDREPKFIAPAIKRAQEFYKKKLKTPRAIQEAMDRLMPDPEGLGIARADVIIEAIFENLEAKQALFKDLESKAKPTAILATNTSSIPLDEINRALKDPGRLVGIHFFNPVSMMQLVEVVKGAASDKSVVDNAIAFVRQIDRLPLPVKSSPGFLVNRVLMPYLMEAMILLEEGTPAPLIDKAAKKFGMPMGPIELADAVGLDVCLAVAKNLSGYFGVPIPAKLEKMVAEKQLGKKSGQGFYHYKNGKMVREKMASGSPVDLKVIADRLILRMLNEAEACLREGVISDADLLDAGMIFGTGFAPFRGGPMYYAKTRGVGEVQAKLKEFEQTYGERFKPDAGWTLSLTQQHKKETAEAV